MSTFNVFVDTYFEENQMSMFSIFICGFTVFVFISCFHVSVVLRSKGVVVFIDLSCRSNMTDSAFLFMVDFLLFNRNPLYV